MSDQLLEQIQEVIVRRMVYGDNAEETSSALNLLGVFFNVHYPERNEAAISEGLAELSKRRLKDVT